MRRTTTTSLPIGLATLCAGTLVVALVATNAAAEQHQGGGGTTTSTAMTANIHPVAAGVDRVDESMSFGTAKFSQGSGKVDVLIQVSGVPLGGREGNPAADGDPATVPFEVRVLKTGDCAKVMGAAELVTLPDLRVMDDGSGVLMASTDKLKLQDLSGQAVVIGVPGNKHRVGCGVIGGK